MNSEGAISGQHSAISSDAVDPLADAHCPKCGYSLRGLPENRCPECGRAFDPAEFTGTFLPRWPQLMAWYLAACIVAQLLDFAPALLRWNRYLFLIFKTGDEPFKNITNITHLIEAAVLCLLGPVSIIGLYRRRDWARKGCIIIFALTVLVWLSYLKPIGEDWLWYGSLVETMRSLWLVLGFAPEGLLAVLVTVFLLTGLRRRSLGRTGEGPGPMLPLSSFRSRRDWPLLAVVILIGLGVGWIWAAWCTLDVMQASLRAIGVTGHVSRESDLYFIALKTRIALGFCALTAACAISFRPSLFRVAAGAVLGTALSLEVFEFIVYWQYYSPAPVALVCDALTRTATVMPHLALALFAFLAISREDIRRLEAQG